MNHTKHGNNVYVVLSERNIRHLLHGLHNGFAEGLVRTCEDDTRLHVRVESDEDHYKERPAGPGLAPFMSQEDK